MFASGPSLTYQRLLSRQMMRRTRGRHDWAILENRGIAFKQATLALTRVSKGPLGI